MHQRSAMHPRCTMSGMGDLAAAWVGAVASLGGDPASGRRSAADLVARYRAPTRRYHGEAHALAVVQNARLLGAQVGLADAQSALVQAAACAHDVVYDGEPGHDELASAHWARAALQHAGAAGAAADKVADLVLATAQHRAPDDDLGAAVLLDADLAILGSAPADYDAYTRAVRAEYAHLSESAWREGRSQVLRSFLQRDRLFVTTAARNAWDVAARTNMTRELRCALGQQV